MNLLLAESVDWTRIIIEYVAYAAVIVVGILILLLLRRKTRLPRHRELRVQLHDLSAAADAFRTQPPTGLKRFKALSALIYRLDKLIYVTDRMADKERDGQIAGISTLLTAARNELFAYRSGQRDLSDEEGLALAQQKIADAAELLERILLRDERLKAGS